MPSTRVANRRIHTHRVRLGLSPEQYGARIGVAGMTVRRVEAGATPFRHTQKKFAAALSTEGHVVQVDDLWPLALDRRERVAA
jgi:DNA-binding transcriptional regulator YiaG